VIVEIALSSNRMEVGPNPGHDLRREQSTMPWTCTSRQPGRERTREDQFDPKGVLAKAKQPFARVA
jgi:hypothetical protein